MSHAFSLLDDERGSVALQGACVLALPAAAAVLAHPDRPYDLRSAAAALGLRGR